MSSSKQPLASWCMVARVSCALLLFAMGFGLVSAKKSVAKKIQSTTADPSPSVCPPCNLLFSKLEWNAKGARVQEISVQERGEPKSGTTFSMEWASEDLYQTCDYLDGLYGSGSCKVSIFYTGIVSHVELNFNPSWGDTEKAICHCEGVERVKIEVEAHFKHLLPVSATCPWSHTDGLAPPEPPCTFKNGTLPSNYEEVLSCIEDAGCEFTGTELQMAVFRDPRPMAVSTFFWMKAHKSIYYSGETIEEYLRRMFPILCQWVSIRYYIFEGFLSHRTSSFWMDEAEADPLAWHRRFFEMVGLQLPGPVVQAACIATTEGKKLHVRVKGRNIHPGGEPVSSNRSYADEVSESTKKFLDEAVVQWLPPTFRAKARVVY